MHMCDIIFISPVLITAMHADNKKKYHVLLHGMALSLGLFQ